MSDASRTNGYLKQSNGHREAFENLTPYHDISSRHADWALRSLAEAAKLDPRDQHPKTVAAHTYAVLSLRDKLDEFVSVAKDIRDLMADKRELTTEPIQTRVDN